MNLSACLILAAAIGGLSACSMTGEQRNAVAIVTLAEACDAYAGALNVLAPQRAAGALSASQVSTVDQLNRIVDPICHNPIPPADPLDAVARVTTAVTQAMLVVYAQQEAAR